MPTGGGGSGGKSVATTFYPISSNFGGASAGLTFALNEITPFGIYIPLMTVTTVTINVTTADAAGLYDIGLYNATGTLLVDTGAIHLPSTGFQTLTLAQGSSTLGPGLVWLAITGNATTAVLGFVANAGGFYAAVGATGVTAGGALPASFTPPAKGIVFNGSLPQCAFST